MRGMNSREGGDIGGGDRAFWADMQAGMDVDAFEEQMANETRAGIEATLFGQAAVEDGDGLGC
jgi:hypothetical protein